MAALSVVLYHATTILHDRNHSGPIWQWIFPAVPIFLGLSGFLVLRSRETTATWGRFAFKRLLRVGPAFVASLLLIAVLFGIPDALHSLSAWANLGAHLVTDSYKNLPLWSLGWEEIFYVVLAVAFALGWYRRPLFCWLALRDRRLGSAFPTGRATNMQNALRIEGTQVQKVAAALGLEPRTR